MKLALNNMEKARRKPLPIRRHNAYSEQDTIQGYPLRLFRIEIFYKLHGRRKSAVEHVWAMSAITAIKQPQIAQYFKQGTQYNIHEINP